MITQPIIRSVLLIVALGSLAIWASREYRKSKAYAVVENQAAPADNLPLVEGPQVVMTYFILGTRCKTCRKIEALATATATQDFAAELASNKLIFRVIDTGEPANRHYVKDYQLTSKTVILSRRLNGKETGWKDMENVWDLYDDPPAYHAYIGTQIRKFLEL